MRAYLSHRASDRPVAVATRNQALNAIVFLYREGLGRDSPQFICVPLQAHVQQGVLKADGVVVAPSMEVRDSDETDCLHAAQTASGYPFAFDIQTPFNALEQEVHLAPIVLDVQRSNVVGCH